ncbi:MAG: Crp/Fnr family transcriptional regulator [Lachnospiraceae bacterium]|nr:Crp/Fnr family transcriptional regulator [Lachnospiraceae bacterium]
MDYDFLAETLLFRGITPGEISTMMDCLGAEKKHYEKKEVICHAGDTISSMGMVLSGCVHIENDDLWGNKSILDQVGPGFVFAETYACIPGEPLMVSVTAAEPSEILFLNTKRLLNTCTGTCSHHSRLIQNLLLVSAQKNLNLSRRMFHMSSKTIRGRLLSYLSFQAARQGSCAFTIPFNRQQLADYLGVDRSALSNELGKMQRDGILQVKKNRFWLAEKENKNGK